MNRKARRAAIAERRHSDIAGPIGISLYHIWPGSDAELWQTLPADRAEKAKEALLNVGIKITEGTGRCSECNSGLRDLKDMGACSVAHAWDAKISIGIPFGRRCAASDDVVSQSATQALARILGEPVDRLQ